MSLQKSHKKCSSTVRVCDKMLQLKSYKVLSDASENIREVKYSSGKLTWLYLPLCKDFSDELSL